MSQNRMIVCPHCGKETSALKMYDLTTSRIYVLYYHQWKTTPIMGCRQCMTKFNFWRTFNDNLIKSNLAWFIIHFPIAVVTQVRTLFGSHSNYVKRCYEESSQFNEAQNLKAYHCWFGMPVYTLPFSLLSKIEVNKFLKKTRQSNSFVWLLKALAQQDGQTYYTSFDGTKVVLTEDTVSPSLMAYDSPAGSELWYRDFFILEKENHRLLDEVKEQLKTMENEYDFVIEKDQHENIHIHAKCKYSVDFNDQPLDQLSWIIAQIDANRNNLFRWFNNRKLIIAKEEANQRS